MLLTGRVQAVSETAAAGDAGATDFSSLNGRPDSDAGFLDLLKSQTGPSLTGPSHKHPTHAQLTKVQLQEDDVAKVWCGAHQSIILIYISMYL